MSALDLVVRILVVLLAALIVFFGVFVLTFIMFWAVPLPSKGYLLGLFIAACALWASVLVVAVRRSGQPHD